MTCAPHREVQKYDLPIRFPIGNLLDLYEVLKLFSGQLIQPNNLFCKLCSSLPSCNFLGEQQSGQPVSLISFDQNQHSPSVMG